MKDKRTKDVIETDIILSYRPTEEGNKANPPTEGSGVPEKTEKK